MKKIIAGFIILGTAVLITAGDLSGEKDQLSYAMGVWLAETLKQTGLEIDESELLKGMNDSLEGHAGITSDEAREILRNAVVKNEEKISAENREKGNKFLSENKARKGVICLESGLQYKIIRKGNGQIPQISDTVKVNYEGTSIAGEIFDSTYDKSAPVTFKISDVIKGWQEALLLMHEGAEWIIYIPSELAYGNSRAGNKIGRNEVLIFRIELLQIEKK